jgi:hypothetical protein
LEAPHIVRAHKGEQNGEQQGVESRGWLTAPHSDPEIQNTSP